MSGAEVAGPARVTRRGGRFWVQWALDPAAGRAIEGALLKYEDGRWTRVERCGRPPADLAASDCFEGALVTPGLVNAHAHLDYSFLRGMLPREEGFAPWVRAMIAARRGLTEASVPAIESARQEAALELATDGVTEVWDVCALDSVSHAGFQEIEWRGFREVIALDGPRWEAVRERLSEEMGVHPTTHWGVSPHSTYTVHLEALREMASLAKSAGWPLAIHLAESPEEREFIAGREGALAEVLGSQETGGSWGPTSAIARADAAGALGPSTLAIHANLPEQGEAELLAERGAVVVFCPRSHRFFGYPPWPLAAYRRAGVRLMLGTDSLASNDRLSIRAEARALGRLAGGPGALECLAWATGALLGEAPPFGGRGRLESGSAAQWALWEPAAPPSVVSPDALAECWLRETTRCLRTSHWPGRP